MNAIDDVCAVKLTGNHEAWALQDGSLPDAAGRVLAAWAVAARREGVLAVHGSPQNPLMGYLSDERTVRAAIDRLPGWLCVHGHTHQAVLWIRDKHGALLRQRRPSSQKLARSARAIACPGAISGPQPKWLLVDTENRRLTWHPLDAVAENESYPTQPQHGVRRLNRDPVVNGAARRDGCPAPVLPNPRLPGEQISHRPGDRTTPVRGRGGPEGGSAQSDQLPVIDERDLLDRRSGARNLDGADRG